jgi:hypothetical protein
LQDAAHVVRKQRPGRAQSHSSRQSVKQRESNFPFQILDLPRQGGLRDMKPRSG